MSKELFHIGTVAIICGVTAGSVFACGWLIGAGAYPLIATLLGLVGGSGMVALGIASWVVAAE